MTVSLAPPLAPPLPHLLVVEHHGETPIKKLWRFLHTNGVLPLQRLADNEEDLGGPGNVLLGYFEVDVFLPVDGAVQGFGGGGDRGAQGSLPVVKGGLDDDRTGATVRGEAGEMIHSLQSKTAMWKRQSE